jgi:uncharacterized protein YndB with AHSA1/START domain
MPHPFRIETSVEIEATPEEVWEALTIGDQLDGWWIGAPNEVEPRLGGAVRQSFGGEISESTITAWDPPHRFVDEGTPGPDGVVHAMEFTLEGRSGTTTVRFVHSGFLGDDWESEYEALAEGDPMYIHQLAEYVRFFRGRPVAIVEHFQPDMTDRQAAMAILRGAMDLGDAVAVGDAVRLEPAGLEPVEGSVDYLSSSIIGLRTDDALYRFAFIPMGGGIYLGHHVYRDDVDVAAVTSAWAAWLDRAVAAGQPGAGKAASAH